MCRVDGIVEVMEPVLQMVGLGSQVNAVLVMEHYLEAKLVLTVTYKCM